MSERVDKILVQLKLVKTRSQAQQLIKKGCVYYQDKLVSKSSQIIENGDELKVTESIEFVGRGAFKIKGAAEFFNLSFKSLVVADVGASTGGFTDYALKQGASKVFAIDVGHDQLAKELVEDLRVVNYEGVNIRHPLELEEKVDIAVVDLSYISLKLTLDSIFMLVKKNAHVLALVKPQFEIGRAGLGKNGVVKKESDHLKVLQDLYRWCEHEGFYIEAFCCSPILGKSGNREFFFLFKNGLDSHQVSFEDLNRLSCERQEELS